MRLQPAKDGKGLYNSNVGESYFKQAKVVCKIKSLYYFRNLKSVVHV